MAAQATSNLLLPDFDRAYWRHKEYVRYRDHRNFSKKKKHFEPEDHSSFASRWAKDLTREEVQEEIRQIYENAVTILANKRSQMERGENHLDCAQFRILIEADQDPIAPKIIRISRALTVRISLNELPPHFDDIFPYKPNELVVPFRGAQASREILAAFEEWQDNLGGRIEESADQLAIKLHLPSGFTLAADLRAQEAIFTKASCEGVASLASAVAQDLQTMGIRRKLE